MLPSSKLQISKLNLDNVLGFCIALPFAYPKEPLYWLGFLVFIAMCFRLKLREGGKKDFFNVILLCAFILLSNLMSVYANEIYFFSILGGFLILMSFLFRYCTRDAQEFLDGFLLVINGYTIATFLVFILLKPYENGFNFFINSELRMWGDGYLIEWPNVFCMFLSLGFYINWIRGNNCWAFLNITASLLTTSRLALLAIAIFIFYYLWNVNGKRAFFLIVLLSVFGAFFIYEINNNQLIASYTTTRLFKTQDRLLIATSLFDVFKNNTLLGIGNISFSSINSLYESYHSSFLKVLIRYGILGFILYLWLIFPKNTLKQIHIKENAPIFFLLIASIFQDMLFHLHFMIMYSVLLGIRDEKINEIKK